MERDAPATMPIRVTDDQRHQAYLAVRAAHEQGEVQYLIDALRDPDHRGAAARYLADLDASEAIPQLMLLLDANDPHLRVAAIQALGQLQAREALLRLREIAASDDEDFVRSWAVGAISEFGDSQDTARLVEFLNDPSMRVRAAAVGGLGRLGDPAALIPLRRAKPSLFTKPVEWYLYRRLYHDAVRSIRTGEPQGRIRRL